jgi:hypothetical protein
MIHFKFAIHLDNLHTLFYLICLMQLVYPKNQNDRPDYYKILFESCFKFHTTTQKKTFET